MMAEMREMLQRRKMKDGTGRVRDGGREHPGTDDSKEVGRATGGRSGGRVEVYGVTRKETTNGERGVARAEGAERGGRNGGAVDTITAETIKKQLQVASAARLPLFYNIFAGEDRIPIFATNAISASASAPASPVAAPTMPRASSASSLRSPPPPPLPLPLLPPPVHSINSPFHAEELLLRVLNDESTLKAFSDYVKTSDWRYEIDKRELDSNGFRSTANGIRFHRDCWAFLGDSIV